MHCFQKLLYSFSVKSSLPSAYMSVLCEECITYSVKDVTNAIVDYFCFLLEQLTRERQVYYLSGLVWSGMFIWHSGQSFYRLIL